MNQRQIEDLARKIMQADPRLGWHSAWIKAVRLIKSVKPHHPRPVRGVMWFNLYRGRSELASAENEGYLGHCSDRKERLPNSHR